MDEMRVSANTLTRCMDDFVEEAMKLIGNGSRLDMFKELSKDRYELLHSAVSMYEVIQRHILNQAEFMDRMMRKMEYLECQNKEILDKRTGA